MPLPTPKTGEDRDSFVSRCMSSEVMKKEFPDREQRVAVCIKQYGKRKGGKNG